MKSDFANRRDLRRSVPGRKVIFSARVIAANIIGPRQVSLTLSEIPILTERVRLLLGFPEGIGLPEGFVAGNPETARGGATGLRTTGEGRVVLGLPIQDWALQQAIALRRVKTD